VGSVVSSHYNFVPESQKNVHSQDVKLRFSWVNSIGTGNKRIRPTRNVSV
jgi:hypothetical protein